MEVTASGLGGDEATESLANGGLMSSVYGVRAGVNGLSSLPRVTARYSHVAKKIAVTVRAINELVTVLRSRQANLSL